MKRNIFLKIFLLCPVLVFSLSCTDLDQAPLSSLGQDSYFETEAQLQYYCNNLYSVLPSHSSWSYGTFGSDDGTDNMTSKNYNSKYVPGLWLVPQTGGSWSFTNIYNYNYFLENAGKKLSEGKITGNTGNINQYFGEVYFFRAYEYFNKLQAFGDFPIITRTLPNNTDSLTEASKRMPMTDVAHFILSDLDKAIGLLESNPDGKKERISKNVALLFKSRVSLYVGTWLKYFKGTAFVPNGDGWPGAQKDYNKNYQFPEGSIDKEISYFLSEAMSSAKQIADNVSLVQNNGILQQNTTDPENPYLDMFADPDLSTYSEVLLWKEYNRGLGVTHDVPIVAQTGDGSVGMTRGFVDNFLMANGLPIYAQGSGYAGDDSISEVRKNRDGRLWLFLKEPGQKNMLFNETGAIRANVVEKYPDIITGDGLLGYSTGYSLRKGGTFDGTQLTDNGGCYTGCIIFRAVEAYLNYMEACYELNGYLDADAQKYWKAIRDRAHVDDDYNKTIAATDMNEETKNDWGAYSGGQLVDKTLYNIRRERRCELMAEGLRMMDLRRWRSLDQLVNNPYHIEGFKLWGPMQKWYLDSKGNSTLVYGTTNANVSSPSQSSYLRPQEINPNSIVYNVGCKWAMAHYLEPIAIKQFLLTANGGDASSSPIYQNPYWPVIAGEGAEK